MIGIIQTLTHGGILLLIGRNRGEGCEMPRAEVTEESVLAVAPSERSRRHCVTMTLGYVLPDGSMSWIVSIILVGGAKFSEVRNIPGLKKFCAAKRSCPAFVPAAPGGSLRSPKSSPRAFPLFVARIQASMEVPHCCASSKVIRSASTRKARNAENSCLQAASREQS